MRPIAASDFHPFGGNIMVDWIRMTPYAASGSFLSRVFDAVTDVDWHAVNWTAVTPAGTTLAISLRTGDTATPDASWTDFVSVAAPGPITAHSRYIQYRVEMTTTDPVTTPELDDIIVTTDRPRLSRSTTPSPRIRTPRWCSRHRVLEPDGERHGSGHAADESARRRRDRAGTRHSRSER